MRSHSTSIGIGLGLGAAVVLGGVVVVAQRDGLSAGNLAVNVGRCSTISAIAGASARATDPANNQGIQFTVPTASANKPLVGQRVCLYPATRTAGKTGLAGASAAAGNTTLNRAVFVQWPAEAKKKATVSVGYMETSVILSNTGRIDGTTKTWTNNNAQGFTGGVKVQLQDKDGNILQWDMPVQKYGVNANNPVSNASAPSERKEDWHFSVPTDVLNQVGRIRILQRHMPQGRWDEAIEMAKELGEVLQTYSQVYTSVQGARGGQ
jgi:hypothetical protein